MNGFFKVPEPKNEPNLTYAPGTKERQEILETYRHLKGQTLDIPLVIGGQEIHTENKKPVIQPSIAADGLME